MNSIPRWANLLMELVFAFLCMGAVQFCVWLKDDPPAPLWGTFLAACIGGMLWSRPTYSRPQDFDK